MTDTAKSHPAEASRSHERACGFAPKDVRRILLPGAAWLWVLISGLLWSLEPWQRPWITRIPSDAILLGAFCSGLLVLVILCWRPRYPARFLRRAIVVVAGGALMLGGLRVGCERLAVAELRSKLEKEMPVPGTFAWQTETRVPLAKKLHDWLEKIDLGPPKWLVYHVSNLRPEFITPAHAFIAASRWPVRRRIADSMVRDPASAEYLMVDWEEFFPAIIGQDVTLACRREWLGQLDVVRKEPHESVSTRQACVAMMALILLTDPPEFEAWRVPVRDAMLLWQDPVYDFRTGQGQSLWYRLLDTLLALDSPESWIRLTKPMAAKEDVYRQALEIPVRGLVGNFDAFLQIFENGKDIGDLFFLWQSVGAGLADHPDSFDAQTTDRIRLWRRDTLFRWLMALGDGTKNDLTQRRISVLHVLGFYPVPPFSEIQQDQLAAAAAACVGKINLAANTGMETVSGHLNQIQHILPYLNEEKADAVRKSLIPVMLQPERFMTRDSNNCVKFDQMWTEFLWVVQPLMSDEEQRLLRDRLAPLMATLDPQPHSSSILLVIDAWSKHPALEPEHWLAQAWVGAPRWRVVPKDTPRDRRAIREWEPHFVPEISEESIDVLAGLLDSAMHASNGKSFQEILVERFHFEHEQRSVRDQFVNGLWRRMHQFTASGATGSEQLVRELKTDLAEIGLFRGDEKIRESLKERVWERKVRSGRFLLDPEHSKMLWPDTLKDPKRAAAEALKSVGEESYFSALNSLIHAMEGSSPDDEVVRAVWDALRARSRAQEDRQEVFGALFRLSHRLPHSERLAMRKDYLDAKLGWLAFTNQSGPLPDSNPLRYSGGGIGIPWEEDKLSVRLSWMTAVDRQRNTYPIVVSSSHRSEVFAFLANGSGLDYPISDIYPPLDRARLSTPLPPTPWQKARALYWKHPDWKFR